MFGATVNRLKMLFPESISTDQAKDTGMAMVLICLLIAIIGNKQYFVISSIPILLMNMILPNFFKPIAKFWFGFSIILGTIMSKVILSVLFFGMVLPVGLFRRIIGKDSLQLKKWKKGSESVFRVRIHEYVPNDIRHPY